VPHLTGWGFELDPDILMDVEPSGIHNVDLYVTPPPDTPLPPDGEPIVDIEAYAEGKLIGGFRKVFRPQISDIYLPIIMKNFSIES
jgi:hypothetical protein